MQASRTRNPAPDGAEQIVVSAAVPEVPRGQGWTTVPAGLSAMTGLAGLLIEVLPAATAAGSPAKGFFCASGVSACCPNAGPAIKDAVDYGVERAR